MFRIFRSLLILLLAPAVRIYLGFLSEMNRLRTLGKKAKKILEKPYDGQGIIILALYQKGDLRPDLIRFLEHAKTQNCYVVAVNTLKLRDPDSLSDLIDCYYEKPNFGRDFSSYKVGFLHVFKNGLEKGCKRLMMVNDSIFFSDERTPKFIAEMMSTEIEVLGSTENFDIDYHLGSFCLAMNESILNNPKFQAYWKNYKLSDVRPTVIYRGELALSVLLKKIAFNPAKITALYSARRFFELTERDIKMIDFVLNNARASTVFAWKRVNARQIIAQYKEEYLENALVEETSNMNVEISEPENLKHWHVKNLEDIEVYLNEALLAQGKPVEKDAVREIALNEIIESFMSGSQIHQNAAVLLKMGLPFVKLDGLYRGIFNMADVYRVSRQLPREEATELRALLMARPYGRRFYTGWRQVAFERGYI